jgi:hypothetical protein
LGILYIASYIKKHGYEDIHFYSQDVYHYPESHLAEIGVNHNDSIDIAKKLIDMANGLN